RAREGARCVDGGGLGGGRLAAVAAWALRRAARLVGAGLSGQVAQVFGIGRIGDIDDRGAVGLGFAGQGIDRRGHVVAAAVMADIGDPALALAMNRRLIGAARLQIAPADQPHVGGFGGCPDFLLLRVCNTGGEQETNDEQCLPRHGVSPWLRDYRPRPAQYRNAPYSGHVARPLPQMSQTGRLARALHAKSIAAMSLENLLLYFLACGAM